MKSVLPVQSTDIVIDIICCQKYCDASRNIQKSAVAWYRNFSFKSYYFWVGWTKPKILNNLNNIDTLIGSCDEVERTDQIVEDIVML